MNKIITHNGIFHADEVFACATLQRFYGSDVPIVRTRNRGVIAAAQSEELTAVVDVGGQFNLFKSNFDHHQKDFDGKRINGTPFSSFGLVWNWFAPKFYPISVVEMVDRWLVEKIDAVDCGVAAKTEEYTVSHIISSFNVNFDESLAETARFHDALSVASAILERVIARANAAKAGEDYVRSKLEDQSPSKLLLLGKFAPWQSIVVKEHPEILYVVFPDISGTWRIQAVPDAEDSFGMRKPLPAEWVEGKPMVEGHPVEDFIFCHKGLFIAGTRGLESATLLAYQALEA